MDNASIGLFISVTFLLIFVVTALIHGIRDTQRGPFSFAVAYTRVTTKITRGTPNSAGLDFYVPFNFTSFSQRFGCVVLGDGDSLKLSPGSSVNIPSGVVVDIPQGYVLIAFNKSGVAVKKGLQVGACVIDEDYRGEIHLHVTNISDSPTTISAGEKLVQFILLPACYANPYTLPMSKMFKGKQSQRGLGGFGSTDKLSSVHGPSNRFSKEVRA